MSTPTLKTEQATKYQKILNAPHLKNHRFVSLGNLATAQSQGKIKFRLAGIACDSLVFRAKTVEYTSEADYYWYGDIRSEEEGACFTGTMMLIAKNGEKYGQITLDDRTFEYQDLGENLQVMSEHKNENWGSCGVDEHTPKGNDALITPEDLERSGCPGTSTSTEPQGTVRVLVLFTPAAVAIEPNINNRANFAIQQTNAIFSNSRILSQNARLVLAGAEVLDFVEDGIAEDRFRLRNNLIAQARRNATNADLVVLMTNGNYGNFNGIVASIGPDNANAYAIVQINDATSNQRVFAHEVGHLFGGRHDEFDPDATFDRGRIFQTGLLNLATNHTIMVRFPFVNIFGVVRGRIDHFSNPNVQYKRRATGTQDRNNALKLNETGNTVASFRPPITTTTPSIPFSVSMSAPATYPACSRGACATSTITCGIPPYSIRWQNSTDGINWSGTVSTGTGYCFVTPCGDGRDFWVRVTVTDSQGNTRVAGTIIELTGSGSGGGVFRTSQESLISNVYPNPLNEQTQISLNLPEADAISIELSNMYGTLRRNILTQTYPAGEHTITIPRNNLPQGVYAIKLTTSSGYSEIKTIVINP